ncbi:MAG TPA: biotin--[acetyl-CoA-carboxylase] ligase [Gaiellaceae bacterium]|nr:biotin--[acetyl-CoA-carboxylase] ligase [Gaiellaceae bacterium]HZQ89828.1 biotin--[acetyl-CoA-carboxylase] ligase [Gaiellaceae bacterium]
MSDLSPELVVPLLRGRLGRPYRYLSETPSTQQELGEDEPEGATVAADHQTQGRGRLGRTWTDAPGRALLFSILLRPAVEMARWPELSIIAGEAVAAAVGAGARVSHPNDVMVAGRKVAGVLPEATAGRIVLGIGVNVNQRTTDLPVGVPKPPTSLYLELGREVERAPLLATILVELERRYDTWSGVS